MTQEDIENMAQIYIRHLDRKNYDKSRQFITDINDRHGKDVAQQVLIRASEIIIKH